MAVRTEICDYLREIFFDLDFDTTAMEINATKQGFIKKNFDGMCSLVTCDFATFILLQIDED